METVEAKPKPVLALKPKQPKPVLALKPKQPKPVLALKPKQPKPIAVYELFFNMLCNIVIQQNRELLHIIAEKEDLDEDLLVQRCVPSQNKMRNYIKQHMKKLG